MSSDDMILTERRGAVLAITLNRPDRLNAASTDMFDAIRARLENIEDARAVLFLGAGRAFCSGADVSSGALVASDPPSASYAALAQHYHPTLRTIASLGVPVVSAVRGAAAGIGSSLALAADFCIASKTAYFLQAFVKVGLVPDGGASWLLPRLVGRARALEMMMLGERIPADRALSWGLIYSVVDDEVLEREAWSLADRLATGPTIALGLLRTNVAYAFDHDQIAAMQREAESQRIARGTADAAEGGKAFLEKRKAEFRGS